MPGGLVKRMIVVGGASCSGKTYLIERMKRRQVGAISSQLGIGDPDDWAFLSVDTFRKRGTCPDRVVLHLDLHNCCRSGLLNFPEQVMRSAESLAVVTLWSPQAVLVERNRRRLVPETCRLLKEYRFLRICRQFRKACLNRSHLKDQSLYQTWFRHVLDLSREQWFIDTSSPVMRIQALDAACLEKCGAKGPAVS